MKEKNWFMKHKIITVILVIFVISIFNGMSKGPKAPTTSQNIQKEETKTVFDVPALVGKNVDQIIATIGQPKENSLPNEQQAKTATEWSIEFGKDDQTLLVTYNVKTRTVVDLFISGENKEKLLKIGNLKENADNYTLEFVKLQRDPSQITGVKVIKK